MSTTEALVRGLSKLYPWEVTASDELEEALSFIQSPFTAKEVIRAGYGTGFVTLVLLAPLFSLLFPLPIALVLVVCLTVLAVHAVHTAPTLAASFGRTEALGQAPNLIGRIVLRMHIQPATENAVQFAADTGFGPLCRSLDYHIDRSLGTPRSGLLSFAETWGSDFPAIRRSCHLLVTAEDASENERERTLNRSLEAILDGTRDQMADFTEKIRSPSTALYAFGVMLPLALVALAPASALVGLSLTVDMFILIYNIFLPISLIGASLWLLVRRPVAFPPPKVGRDHPDATSSLPWSLFIGVVGAIGLFMIAVLIDLRHLALVSAIGFGIGLFLFQLYRPVAKVRNHVRAVEAHLVDALYIAGRQIDEGESVEAAIDLAGERVPGETGAVFQTASRLQNQLHLTVEQSFLGKYGALKDVPSPRAHGTVSLLSVAAKEGRPAGETIVGMADHLEDLQDVERQTRRELSQVTGTLHNTAMFFGPLVAGATVGLAGAMSTEGLAGGELGSVPTDALATIVGIYLIMLCFILTPLSVGLRYGLDRPLVGYEVSKALMVASPLYVVSVFLVGLVI